MILKSPVKRLGVFIFYDKDGIVDDYVEYLLHSLKEATDDIIIVSNTDLVEKEYQKLEVFSNKIRIRENIGMDAGAFKYAFDEFSNYFQEFDELILLNDTFYGPFVPFQKICDDMNPKDLDFWGLTANYDSVDSFGNLPDKMIHSHIQTFFIAFRNSVLRSKIFNEYWKNYDVSNMKSFREVVTKHEIAFTHYLEKHGFQWDVYTDLSKYRSESLEENFNIYAYASYDLIKNYHCPFIKRKNLIFDKGDALYLCDSNDSSRVFNYLKQNNIYDVNMIFKNLARIYNPKNIYYGLNLNYSVVETKDKYRYAIILYLNNMKYLHIYMDFLKNTDLKNIFVFTDSSEIIETIKKEKLKVLFKESFDKKNFDYLGVISDEVTNHVQMPISYINNVNNIIQNGFYNENYVNGIGRIFNDNRYLGMLLLPVSFHSNYIGNLGKSDISYNENSFFIKSIFFHEKLLNSKDSINEALRLMNAAKLLYGKVYNQEDMIYTIGNQDYINTKVFNALKKHNIPVTNLNQVVHHISTTTCYVSKSQRIKNIIYRILKKLGIK